MVGSGDDRNWSSSTSTVLRSIDASTRLDSISMRASLAAPRPFTVRSRPRPTSMVRRSPAKPEVAIREYAAIAASRWAASGTWRRVACSTAALNAETSECAPRIIQ